MYRGHVARLRQELNQRHLAADASADFPPAFGWAAGGLSGFIDSGSSLTDDSKMLENGRAQKSRGSLPPSENGHRLRSAVSEHYWADRKGHPHPISRFRVLVLLVNELNVQELVKLWMYFELVD